jgi:hypothetical protein
MMGYSNGTAQQNTEDLHTTGKVDGALTFNGSSDYVDTNDTFESVFQDSFSINCWIKPVDGRPISSQNIYGCYKYDEVAYEVVLALYSNGKITAFYSAFGETVIELTTQEAVFEDGVTEWTMITMIVEEISSTTIKIHLFVNGSLLISGDESETQMSSYSSDSKFFIGVYNQNGNPAFPGIEGIIDNVMIFNKALSQTEVDLLYNNGAGLNGLDSGGFIYKW